MCREKNEIGVGLCSCRKYLYPPPARKGLEIREGWGVDSMNFFFPQTGLNIIFIQLYVKFRCLHFASRVADAKKKILLI